MRQQNVLLWVFIVCLLCTSMPVAQASPSLDDMFDVRVYYGPEATEIITASLNLGIVNADGTINGTLTLKSNTDLTYAILPQVSNISGPGADQLRNRTFPQIIGRSTITTENILFTKDSHINLTLGKLGVISGDTQYIVYCWITRPHPHHETGRC